MSVRSLVETSENLFGFPEKIKASVDSALIFEEITRELEEYLLKESDDNDSTDGVFKFLTTISDQIQEEFEELLDGDSDKKRFLKALSKIYCRKKKKKKKLKIALEATVKLWSGQN